MMSDDGYFEHTLTVLKFMNENGIEAVVYGSVGVSVYLGKFKTEFNDIDLLINDERLQSQWLQLQEVMRSNGFRMVNEHEHEFINPQGVDVAFAPISILERDGIVDSLDELSVLNVAGYRIQTLTAEQFKRAYEFSVRDGYRRETRGKKDAEVIRLLDGYLRDKNPRE